MARKSKYADWTNAELILHYAMQFYDKTKAAAKEEEEKILKELAAREIIDSEEMKKLYEKYSL